MTWSWFDTVSGRDNMSVINAVLSRADRVQVQVACLAISVGILAVLLDTVLDVPVRLPGHRAFPGALTILLFADSFVPMVLGSGKRLRRSAWVFCGVGASYGLARFFLLLGGLHHTPLQLRLGGHLAFGMVAGLAALGSIRLLTTRRKS